MDSEKLERDFEVLLELEKQGVIRGVDWNINGQDDWIIINGAVPLPPGEFNLPDVNIKLPIPANLYEMSSKNRCHFYSTIFIDEKLRRSTATGWKTIARQLPYMHPKEASKGWAFLCVIPRDARMGTGIEALFPIIQSWIMENGDKRR